MKKLATLATLMAMAFSSQAADLYLYAGAGLKDPVEKIVQQFEKNTGNKVTVEYGGSGQILARYNQSENRRFVFIRLRRLCREIATS